MQHRMCMCSVSGCRKKGGKKNTFPSSKICCPRFLFFLQGNYFFFLQFTITIENGHTHTNKHTHRNTSCACLGLFHRIFIIAATATAAPTTTHNSHLPTAFHETFSFQLHQRTNANEIRTLHFRTRPKYRERDRKTHKKKPTLTKKKYRRNV